MKDYSNATWDYLNTFGHISPIKGINVVTSRQVASYLNMELRELVKPRTKAASDLKQLGMFSASAKDLAPKVPDAKRDSAYDYIFPLEDGTMMQVQNSKLVYFPASAVARLMDEIHNPTPKKRKDEINVEERVLDSGVARKFESGRSNTLAATTIFENPEFGKVRVLEIDGEPWLVGKDVAEALGYERPTKAIPGHVDEDDRMMVDGKTQSQFGIELGQRGGWLINESGLYSLVLSSKLPGAKKFRRWVTSEVLPTIRKHGMYVMDSKLDSLLADPENAIKVFTALKEERDKRKALENRVAALEDENCMLAKKERTWDRRSLVVRLVRLYGHTVCGGNFQAGWKTFYHELLYKKNINLNRRICGGSYFDRVKDNEWDDLLSVAVSMCKTSGIDLS